MNTLITLLKQDTWQRGAALAKILEVSATTIKHRLRQLIQNGTVRAVPLLIVLQLRYL